MFVKAAWEFHLRAVFLRKQLATFGVLLDTTRAAYQVELDAIKKTGGGLANNRITKTTKTITQQKR